MQKINIILADRTYAGQAMELEQRLGKEGVGCEVRWLPEAGIGEFPEQEGQKALWISDDSCVTKRLLASGRYVLAFLHEGNAADDFSLCRFACENLAELETGYLDRVWRRYVRLPWDILETERCLVRETTEEDVEDFYRIYSDPSITEYMEGLYEDPEQERAYARDYIDQVYNFYNFGLWTVVDKRSGEVIGRAGIYYREGYVEPELGFLIAKPWQGRGYATEVCEAIITYAREELGFSRTLAFVHPENAASLHICRKLGLEIHDRREK